MRPAAAALLAALLGLLGCDEEPQEPACDRPAARMEGEDGIHACVLQRGCSFSSCHGPAGSGAGLRMDTPAAACAALVGVTSQQEPPRKRVEPGAPGASYLLAKLRGEQSTGSVMPPPSAGPALPEGQLEAIVEWIAAGAICD